MAALRNMIMVSASMLCLAACATQETPRALEDVSSSNTIPLTAPEITRADEDGLSIRYAQISIGFDAGCNPNRSFSYDLNECAKLPEAVKTMAAEHCEGYGKMAVFSGNRTNILQMTVSKFRCETPEG